jgi:capsular polysaccharide biosynthesis protein/Mrp family chromosome partitioning ATPase
VSSTSSDPYASDSVVSLSQTVGVLRRHWLVIVACVLLGILAGGVLYAVTPATYQSTATVRVFPLPADLRSPTVNQKDISMATEVGVATSATVAASAAEALGWTQSTDLLVKNVSVSNPTDSFLLDITYTADTAKGAAAGADAFAEAYLAERRQLAEDAATQVSKGIDAQIAELNKKVDAINKVIGGTSGIAQDNLIEQRRTYLSQIQTLQGVLSEVKLVSLTPGALVGPATVPQSKSAPKLLVYVGGGALLGLLLGLVLAWVRDRRDGRVHAGDNLEELTGLPVLGRVPEVAAASGPNGLRLAGVVPDAYRQLAIRMVTRGPKSRPVVCLVAGTGAPGARTVPGMIAQAFAAEGSRVALASVDGAVVQCHATLPFDNVRLGPEDQVLRRLHAAEPLPEITRGDFEVVVIDAVNLTMESSTLALAHAARGVVLTVIEGRSRQSDVLEAVRDMVRSGTPLVGLVLVVPSREGRAEPSRTAAGGPVPAATPPVAGEPKATSGTAAPGKAPAATARRPAAAKSRPDAPAGRT